MIKYIWLDNWSDYKSDNDERDYLELGKLNIFIGRNNSGKSRLLRSLFASDASNITYALTTDNLEDFQTELKNISKFIPKNSTVNSINGEQFSDLIIRDPVILNYEERKFFNGLQNDLQRIKSGSVSQSGSPQTHFLQRDLKSYYMNNNKVMLSDLDFKYITDNKIYIPISIFGVRVKTHNIWGQRIMALLRALRIIFCFTHYRSVEL